MIVLGVDPGTASTGWGVIKVENGSYKLLDFGVISPKTKVLSEKYAIIYDGLNNVLDKYKADCVSVETQFVYKNAQSAIKIGMARGMALLAGAKRGLPIFEYTPLKAKQAVTGSGRADKDDVKKMIGILLNISQNIPHDAADGLALAICHAHFANSPLAKSI